jgi:hypothetical protein
MRPDAGAVNSEQKIWAGITVVPAFSFCRHPKGVPLRAPISLLCKVASTKAIMLIVRKEASG